MVNKITFKDAYTDLSKYDIIRLSINKIKTMPKKYSRKSSLTRVRAAVITVFGVALIGASSFVHADIYQAQIDALQN